MLRTIHSLMNAIPIPIMTNPLKLTSSGEYSLKNRLWLIIFVRVMDGIDMIESTLSELT